MVARANLLASGVPAAAANLLGTALNKTLAAAGTTQATATAMKGCGFAVVTTVGLNSGIILDPPGPDQTIVNAGQNTLTIYPALGCVINGLAANTGIQLAVGKAAHFPGHEKNYAAILSS